MDYQSYLRVHLTPFFGDRPLDAIDSGDIEAFIAERVDAGKASKSIKNWVALLHSIFDYAIKRGWCSANPCKLVELPRSVDVDPDIRFLDAAELHAVVAAAPDDTLGSTERALYPTAATTRLRQGECSRCAGGTSTGARRRSASARTTCAGSTGRRSRSARRVRCR